MREYVYAGRGKAGRRACAGVLAALFFAFALAWVSPGKTGYALSSETSEAGDPGIETFSWGFKKAKGGNPPSIDEEGFRELVERFGARFYDPSGKKVVYLTFDNGYENGYTARILDVLREKGVPAAFFVTGHYVKSQPELVRRMVREGHIVGNHSYHHPDMSRMSAAEIRADLEKLNAAVREIVPEAEIRYFRPPRGIFDEKTLATARDLGMTTVFWSIAYKDWDTKVVHGGDYAVRQVLEQLHPGAVILLHSVSRDNAEGLPRIIDEVRAQGYTFRSLDDWGK
ncbi:delta-lactam-biosynthetic de-N-acetylase [Brockia lithotrophica]|uniref:Peptidoglycan-N-acetylmuramic acid deacetylase n=1 Tax=Brockia lithotrophica TaxID=933949 RepID=A0A660L5T8_9BACL|nr:delta-lactam-biosynthetic de-N-acetylase [Brockia lithotrophica]RKQ88705.1 peptidoglycan-N-acetylmuramic acid deacetylase [Brockia lithotrophica]